MLTSALASMFLPVAGCSVDRPMHSGHPGILSRFQFVQDGRIVEPDEGIIRMARRPFTIRHRGDGTTPSVFASAAPGMGRQVARMSNPLVTWEGTGMATLERNLDVSEETMTLYEGWSPAFEHDWGATFTAEQRAFYSAFRDQRPTEPQLTMTGRDYNNFKTQPDGSEAFEVLLMNGDAVAHGRHETIYLLLFSEQSRPRNLEIEPYQLHWTPIMLEFSED